MATITFTEGPIAGRTFALPDQPVLLGRDDSLDLFLDDGAVSGRHVEIRPENGQWIIRDLGSSNGTQVNGANIDSHRLLDTDIVTIGDSTITFRKDEFVGIPLSAMSAATREIKVDASEEEVALVGRMRDRTERIRREVGKVIVGQQQVIDQVLMCLMAGGHALLIGLPGMAKTLLVRTLASVLELDFKRVQFTPDLMPMDIIGTDVLETNVSTGEKEFRFLPGPIFCNLLLADEINRTPPKTQSALLEAMQEMRVTAGNTTYSLDRPFFVMATQNPIEQEGTYPLPEAQMDRFMFNIWVDYPAELEEEDIVATTTVARQKEPEPMLSKEQVVQLQEVVRKIPVSRHVVKFAIHLVRATRPKDPRAPEFVNQFVSVGAGPRAGQYLVLGAKARAALEGRYHVSCEDIRRVALPVLRHRIITNFTADSEGLSSSDLVRRLLAEVQEPTAADYA
jgi:MoxR-like ATPase